MILTEAGFSVANLAVQRWTQMFNEDGQDWELLQLVEAGFLLKKNGWTHCASVKRPNGKKTYYANLVMHEGVIINSKVIGVK